MAAKTGRQILHYLAERFSAELCLGAVEKQNAYMFSAELA